MGKPIEARVGGPNSIDTLIKKGFTQQPDGIKTRAVRVFREIDGQEVSYTIFKPIEGKQSPKIPRWD